MMMDEYYNYQKQLELEYGDKSVVFMMVGSFYETYEYNDVGRASEISPIMNITLTKRNKNKELSGNNPLMCGFPSYALKKYLDMLIRENGYTIGIVDQVDDDDDATVKKKSTTGKARSMDRIYGPSIPYEYDFIESTLENNDEFASQKKSCMVFQVFFEKCHPITKKKAYHIVCSIYDLFVGHVWVTETTFIDIEEVLRQVQEWWLEFGVVECVQLGSNKYFDLIKIQDSSLPRSHHNSNPDTKFAVLAFQQKVLNAVYDIPTNIVIAELNLERHPMIVQVITFGFDFLYRQSPMLVKKLQRPVFLQPANQHLYMDTHVFHELDIIPKQHFRHTQKQLSLIDILDKTKTNMGSRYLRHICFHPTTNCEDLHARYNRIQNYIQNWDNTKTIRRIFESLGDLEVQFRAMTLRKISPITVSRFIESLQACLSLFPWIEPIIRDARQIWDLSVMSSLAGNNSFYEKNFYKSPDIVFPELDDLTSQLQSLSGRFSNSVVKVSNTNPLESHVYLTKIAYRKSMSEIQSKPKDIRIEEHKQGYQITTDTIDAMKYRLNKSISQAQTCLKKVFHDDVTRIFVEKHGTIIHNLIRKIEEMDVDTTFALFSQTNGYCRPMLIKSETNSSVFAKDMRHAILEFVHTDEKFVTNTVSMEDTVHGYIVYGLNSAGKSTLLRSIGICVYLSQIGMYVPCSEFRISPFTRLMTKISNADDMYQKQSTFMFEMSELKHILSQADSRSMVLCDELTSGTETLSATGIMASAITECVDKKCKFMMTTHLHTLAEFPEIVENKNIFVCHFRVRIDGEHIQYDRRLEQGMGDPVYGIEIVHALGFDKRFTDRAFQFRKRISKKQNIFDHSDRRSRYNRKLIMDACDECGSTENLHTHHIAPQKDADEFGLIDNEFHKNKLFNLQVLCESCHQKEHADMQEKRK